MFGQLSTSWCISLALASACAVIALAQPALAQPRESLAPQDGVLLLTNGQALRGKVTHAGDYYFVTLAAGEIRLKNSDVELFCLDLEDGYRRKRAAIIEGQADEYLNLASWCIRHGLLDHAAKELDQAYQADPTHPKIALLERRRQLATKPAQEATTATAAREATVTNDDLDRLARGLPAAVVEQFNSTVQPLLVNNCATGGCHGPGSTNDYNLLRVSGKSNNRHTKLRNLYNTLRFIDQANPAASPLLTAPIREHGTSAAPIFTQRDMPQYQQLVLWANRISASLSTAGQSAPQAASLGKKSEPLLQPTLGPSQSQPPQSTPATPNDKPPAPGAALQPEATGDPFDPEAFNRKFFPDG